MSVNLNLKNGVYWRLSVVERRPSDVLSCLFCAITSKKEEMISSRAAWTEALQRSVRTYERATKRYSFFWIPLQNDNIWKLRLLARFTKQGKLTLKRNSIKTPTGGENSAGDLLTRCTFNNTEPARSFPKWPAQSSKSSANYRLL